MSSTRQRCRARCTDRPPASARDFYSADRAAEPIRRQPWTPRVRPRLIGFLLSRSSDDDADRKTIWDAHRRTKRPNLPHAATTIIVITIKIIIMCGLSVVAVPGHTSTVRRDNTCPRVSAPRCNNTYPHTPPRLTGRRATTGRTESAVYGGFDECVIPEGRGPNRQIVRVEFKSGSGVTFLGGNRFFFWIILVVPMYCECDDFIPLLSPRFLPNSGFFLDARRLS